MARTQAADFEQRREKIVERAAQLFAERGFLGASIADLAKACKTSKSLIYHYYSSKEEILFDVMHRMSGGSSTRRRRLPPRPAMRGKSFAP